MMLVSRTFLSNYENLSIQFSHITLPISIHRLESVNNPVLFTKLLFLELLIQYLEFCLFLIYVIQ